MAKVNYEFKAKVLSDFDFVVSEQRKISKAFYADYILYKDGLVAYSEYDTETAWERQSFLMSEYPTQYNEAIKLNHAFYERKKRLQRTIESMVNNFDCVFATLTFTDSYLEATTPENRRKYISRFLRSFGVPYVANIDFGDNHTYTDTKGVERQATAREHYHAVIAIGNIPLDKYKFGHIFVEKVVKSTNEVKLAKYVSKLSNHAIKETARQSRLLYSR